LSLEGAGCIGQLVQTQGKDILRYCAACSVFVRSVVPINYVKPFALLFATYLTRRARVRKGKVVFMHAATTYGGVEV